MKLVAVLNDESGLTAANCCGFSGSHCWTRWIAYTTSAPVEQAFQWTANALRPRRTPVIDSGHIGPEWLCQEQQDNYVDAKLQPTRGVHEKSSGLNSAMTR